MKKKSLMFLTIVTLVIAAFAIADPAIAGKGNNDHGRAVFESDIVPAAMGDHSLEKGEVYIRENGSYKVEIEGARPNTTYRVFLVFGSSGSLVREQLGELETDEEGEGKLVGTLCFDDEDFVDMPKIKLRSMGTLQFVSGFVPVICDPPAEPEPPVDTYYGPTDPPME